MKLFTFTTMVLFGVAFFARWSLLGKPRVQPTLTTQLVGMALTLSLFAWGFLVLVFHQP